MSHSRTTPPRTGQQGMTLIEVMISVTISLVLLAGVLQIFASNKETYRVQDAMARVQEGGRFAIRFLTKDLRMAGYMGCTSINSQNSPPVNMADINNDGVADIVADFTGDGLQGWESSQLPIVLSDTQDLTSTEATASTDIISIKRAADTGARLTSNLTSVNANIRLDTVTASGMFEADDIMLITDCEKTDIFAATSVANGAGTTIVVHSNAVNTGNNLSKVYAADAEVMSLINTVYYVGPNATGEPSLYRQELGNAGVLSTQELVEGVEDMQISYGVDTDGDRTANVYVDADNALAADMRLVVSVRVALTLRTLDETVATTISPGFSDRRLRRTFTTTVTLRNRVV